MNEQTKESIKHQIAASIAQQNALDARYLQTYRRSLRHAASIHTLASCEQIPILKLNKTAYNSSSIDGSLGDLLSKSSLSSTSLRSLNSLNSHKTKPLTILQSYRFIEEISVFRTLYSCIRHHDIDFHGRSHHRSSDPLLSKNIKYLKLLHLFLLIPNDNRL